MARQSKYAEIAEKLYANAGFSISKRSSNRLDKITTFLKNNSKFAMNVEVFTDSTKIDKMKKFILVGKTNARERNGASTSVYAGIK
jgi:uncharacterized protein YozE (UPF0346 family)